MALILAAMDTGSSFEGMGASREALYGALVEPALMLVFGTLALLSGYTSFDAIFSGDAVNGVQLVVVLLLAAYVLVKIVFTEAGRVPVDDPRTHLELTMIHEVMCLDYCGVDLAYIKMAGWLKTAALSVLAADAVAGDAAAPAGGRRPRSRCSSRGFRWASSNRPRPATNSPATPPSSSPSRRWPSSCSSRATCCNLTSVMQ